MKRSRFTESQIVGILKEADSRCCRQRDLAQAWDQFGYLLYIWTGSPSLLAEFAECRLLCLSRNRLRTYIRRQGKSQRPNGNPREQASTNGRPQGAVIESQVPCSPDRPVSHYQSSAHSSIGFAYTAFWYDWPDASNDQITRAILLAIATIARLEPRRA